MKKKTVKRTTKLDFYVGNKKAGSITVQEWSGTGTRKVSRRVVRKNEFEMLCPSIKRGLIDYDRAFDYTPKLIY
jgi:hypothetical protein